ncbi:hypothetical protein CANCADRAFT_84316 [Tortispora caseinolytica NRRL Y-17796]|uniref:PCI domain-containing protein n=1 Tax=Tortispora caseinolytica NRRL Y-17796 TaxID=767744 RepID=A0A1E4TKG8_9ASCO|nr:hypothetical protein CANCADRAFT_84316 [Tortispora caseinolytica NRRL Y-17796]
MTVEDATNDGLTGNVPDLRLSQLVFEVLNEQFSEEKRESARIELMDTIMANNMSGFWYYLHTTYPNLNVEWDEKKYEEMLSKAADVLADLETKIAEAEEADGEVEVARGWTKVGEFWARNGNKTRALETLRNAYEKTSGVGNQVDILLTIIRVGMLFDDKNLIRTELENAELLVDRGGDWDRRNRLKTYKGLYCISVRNFEEGAKLLIDSRSTFTSTEVCTYEHVVALTVLAGALTLERVELKTKVIDSPEVLQLIPTTPALEPLTSLTNSLYLCDYATFFKSLAQVEETFLTLHRDLVPHSAYYVREMRRKAYAQLLESYRALSLRSMADAFGVTVEFLDADLSKFIPNRQLNCVIDRVNGVVLTNRPDTKNAQYQALLKQGDILLTKLQKYGAAVRLSPAERV